ncbi:MAG TPA: 3-deoxy-8-phosphooctulonate synthase [Longimicrobiales bacterium]|nr:3-deoxy-8-phosphooctulonate synthase [Longimicrobiales bacterium]
MSMDALFDGRFFLIAGPCVLEDDALNLQVGEALADLQARTGVPIVFKASFDKANRSRAGAARGPGLEEGLRRLERVGAATGLPLLTDVHEAQQAAAVGAVCDVLQIPAFLSRQTDLVEAAARTGRSVNIKKGQWMAPEDIGGAVDKARAAGAAAVAVTERGTFLGYGDLVVDMRSFARMREATGATVIFDGTHSVQRPGRADGASGGDPQFIQPLVLAAMAAGANALFLEVHPQPERAPSDGSNMLPLDRLPALLERVLDVRAAARREEEEVMRAGGR